MATYVGAVAPPVAALGPRFNFVFVFVPYTSVPSLVEVGAFVFDLMREQSHIFGLYQLLWTHRVHVRTQYSFSHHAPIYQVW